MKKLLEVKGGKIGYEVIGIGEPVILIHGGPGLLSDYFCEFKRQLANEGFQVVVYDQRGNGSSMDFDIGAITVQGMVDDLEALRCCLGCQRLNLFGHSFGGLIGAKYCKSFPHRIKNCIICNPGPAIEEDVVKFTVAFNERLGMTQDEWKDIGVQVQRGSLDAYDRFLDQIAGICFENKTIGKTIIRYAFGNLSNFSRYVEISDELFLNMVTDFEPLGEDVRSLIIYGQEDVFSVRAVDSYKASNSLIRCIKGAGHYAFSDQPQEVVATVKAFLVC